MKRIEKNGTRDNRKSIHLWFSIKEPVSRVMKFYNQANGVGGAFYFESPRNNNRVWCYMQMSLSDYHNVMVFR